MCSRSTAARRSRKSSTPPRVDRLADHAEQARAGVDRDGAAGVDRGLRDDHRERGLAGAVAAGQPQARRRRRGSRRSSRDVMADLAHLRRAAALDVDHVGVLEGDRAVALGDPPLERARADRGDPQRPAAARAGGPRLVVLDEAAAVAEAELARAGMAHRIGAPAARGLRSSQLRVLLRARVVHEARVLRPERQHRRCRPGRCGSWR